MLEKIKQFIGKNPKSSILGAVAAGVVLSSSGMIVKKNLEHDNLKQESVSAAKFQGVQSSFYNAEPGSQVILDVTAEVPSYRLQDLKSGESAASVYCQVNGSAEGVVDFSNNIISFTNNTEDLKNVKIDLPVPSEGYKGDYGYGYFVVCGDRVSDNSYKVNFVKRVVYNVLPISEQKKDNLTTFSYKQ